MNHKNLQQNVVDGRYGIVAKLLENGSTVLNKIKQSSKNRKLAEIRAKDILIRMSWRNSEFKKEIICFSDELGQPIHRSVRT